MNRNRILILAALALFCLAAKPLHAAETIQLAGEMREYSIGTEWTEATLDLTPVNSVMGGIGASILNPSKSRILIDSIQFRPVLSVQD